MAEKPGHSGRLSCLLKLALKSMVLGLMALTTVGTAQAVAEELTNLQYDEQTRSLTLTLPESVTPQISVLAPDQLILELPDTQVGDLQTQRIQDGIVDSIVLEQATPETAWVVMEFVEGTVLSESQSAVPVAAANSVNTGSGEQAWEVRPALSATSRRAVIEPVAAIQDASPGASASSLRTSTAEIAQAPDFSELPVLEPAVPINEPVSVPPLDSPVSVPPFEPESMDSDLIEPVLTESETTAVEVEVIPTLEETAAVSEPLPEEPPFLEPPFLEESDSLENVADSSELETEALEPLADNPPEPIFIDLEVADEMADEEVVAEGITNEEFVVTEPTDTASDVFVEESADSRIASGQNVSAADEVFVPEATIEPAAQIETVESLQPANESRWPDPIPFGQPLPR